MTSTSRAILPTDKEELQAVAFEAAKEAKKRLPAWQTFARILSRNPHLRIELTADMCATDGSKIYLPTPIELGLKAKHDLASCGKRDENAIQLCHACKLSETANIYVIHEVAHLVYNTFGALSAEEKVKVVQRAVDLECTKNPDSRRAKALQGRVQRAVEGGANYFTVLSSINPHLPLLMNACEDMRVNRETMEARQGTQDMFRAMYNDIFQNGVKRSDGTVNLWAEAPLNAQMMIGVFCRVSTLPYEDWLDEQIIKDLQDSGLSEVLDRIEEAREVHEVFEQVFPLMTELRRLGYFLNPDDMDEEDEAEDDEEAGDPDPDSSEGESSDDSADDNGEGSGGEPDDSSGDQAPEESDGEGTGASDPNAEEGSGVENDDGEGTDGKSGDSSDGEESESDSGGSDASEHADGETCDDPSSDGGEQGGGQESPDSSDGPGQGQSIAGPGSGSGSGAGGEGEREESSPVESSDESSADGLDGKDDPRRPAERPSDGLGDEDPTDTPGDAGEAGRDDSSGQSDDVSDEASSRPDPDRLGSYSETKELFQTFIQHQDDEPPLEEQEDYDPDAYNREDTIAEKLQEDEDLGAYSYSPKDRMSSDPEETLKAAIRRALDQGEHFMGASSTIKGVEIGKVGAFGPPHEQEIIKVPEQILAPSLNQLRAVFTNNRKRKNERHRKSGKVDARVLGRRAAIGDERIFKKRSLPGKRDYFVLIGLDVSGSTGGPRSATLRNIKAAAMAKAELLSRLGIDFAMYSHSGGFEGGGFNGSYDSGLMLSISEIKTPNEPWGDEQRQALSNLNSYAANLDGHTLEFYRQIVEKSKATDRMILYYTDGAMPAENFDEELAILKREIATCEKLGIDLIGIGVGNRDPEKYGLRTIGLDSVEDVPNVVTEMRKLLQ